MKIRNGFVSNSSSSSFLIAFRPEAFIGIEKREMLQSQINFFLNEKDLKIRNDNKDSIHSDVGQMLFYELDRITPLRSVQSILDFLDYEDENELDDITERAISLSKKGFHIFIGDLSHDGDGGSELSNLVCEQRYDYKINESHLKLYIGGIT